MRLKIVAAITLAALLGAGCTQPITPGASPEPSGMPSPEGFVAFHSGFGKIPGTAPHAAAMWNGEAITWTAEPPKAYMEATVLRRQPTLPTPAFLANITTALRIPAGALNANPVTETARVEWRDGKGYRWSYDAAENRLLFAATASATRPLTTTILPDDARLITLATMFAKDRGLADIAWGDPSLAFAWGAWWSVEASAGRCMTTDARNAIRAIAEHPEAWPELPALEKSGTDACVAPEFPSRVIVRFQMRQDDQLVYDAKGSGVPIAEFIVQTDTGTVESGVIELVQNADRSNYPAKSQAAILQELRVGGLRGADGLAPNDRVSVIEFSRALYRHDAAINGTPRTFFIPALVARGRVTHANGASSPYTTLIPLVADEGYADF